jgi:hypothetical protein
MGIIGTVAGKQCTPSLEDFEGFGRDEKDGWNDVQ